MKGLETKFIHILKDGKNIERVIENKAQIESTLVVVKSEKKEN